MVTHHSFKSFLSLLCSNLVIILGVVYRPQILGVVYRPQGVCYNVVGFVVLL
jgi:hypothetical protein